MTGFAQLESGHGLHCKPFGITMRSDVLKPLCMFTGLTCNGHLILPQASGEEDETR